jgi:SAM-dependent methyltransferase
VNTVSNTKCDFCGSDEYDEVYKPIGSKREAVVCICRNCDLVFSIHSNIPYSREPNPSGDADWGNVRFCKGQRFDAIKDLLPIDAQFVLDVGSSRGHFVRWYHAQNPGAYIMAVEPDTRVNDLNPIEADIFYGEKLENLQIPSNSINFIYCCQTLEHVDSASQILKQMYDILLPGGKLFIEVPNLAVIGYPLNIEEFFIDKHNFHFSKRVLCHYMESMGFEIESLNDDNLNVRILAVKGLPTVHYTPILGDMNSHVLIKHYASVIGQNREKLPDVVAKINRIMEGQRVAFWGANTMLDLMVKYGRFDATKVECLVDSYLPEGMEIHGIPVQRPEKLRVYQPDVVVILARHSANDIMKIARTYGVRNVIRFSDLL